MHALDRALGHASEGLDVFLGLAIVVVALAVVARAHAAAGWLLAAGAGARIAATVLVRVQSVLASGDASRDWQRIFLVNQIAYLAGTLAFWASVAVAAAMLARAAAAARR